MADNEQKVDKLAERVSSLEIRVSETTANLNSLISEFKDFKEEMRDRDNQRATDIREIRSSIDSMGKHVRNLAITSMAAIGGMAIAVGAMVVTVIYSVSNK